MNPGRRSDAQSSGQQPGCANETKTHTAFTGAVVLAAGAGSRMGYRPKSLLELNGVPLIQRLLTALSETGVSEVVVVLGHYGKQVESAIAPHPTMPIRLVHNPVPDAGQATSLCIGLRTLSAQVQAVLVVLADQPLVEHQDIQALIKAYQNRPTGTQMVQPSVAGLPGNPVIFSAEVRAQLLEGSEGMGGRQWQAAHPEKVYRWPTANTHYRTDLDTLADIEALASRTGQRLMWPDTKGANRL